MVTLKVWKQFYSGNISQKASYSTLVANLYFLSISEDCFLNFFPMQL